VERIYERYGYDLYEESRHIQGSGHKAGQALPTFVQLISISPAKTPPLIRGN
jgi:hypothetical protein